MNKNTTHQTGSAPDRILAAASDLFYRQGYRATGINEVIATSGVAKATFYNHFPSKEALARAYIEGARDAELDYLDQCIGGRTEPVDRFLAVIDSVEPWLRKTEFRGCPFINLAAEVPDPASPLRQAGIAVYNGARDRIRTVADELIASDPDRFRHLDAQELADDYFQIFAGAIALAEIYHELWPVEQARAATRRLIGA